MITTQLKQISNNSDTKERTMISNRVNGTLSSEDQAAIMGAITTLRTLKVGEAH